MPFGQEISTILTILSVLLSVLIVWISRTERVGCYLSPMPFGQEISTISTILSVLLLVWIVWISRAERVGCYISPMPFWQEISTISTILSVLLSVWIVWISRAERVGCYIFRVSVPVRARLWLLYAGFCVWRCVHRAKLTLQVLVVPRLRHHGCIVCGVRKWRNMHFPTMPSAQVN